MEQGTQKAHEQKQSAPVAPTMSEAGFCLNVRMLDEHGQEVQLTFRCTRASDSKGLIGHYSNTVKDLLQAGWQASKPGARSASPSGAGSDAGGVPTCPVHGGQMKPSRKPGSFFCSKKNADGSYCQQKGGQG